MPKFSGEIYLHTALSSSTQKSHPAFPWAEAGHRQGLHLLPMGNQVHPESLTSKDLNYTSLNSLLKVEIFFFFKRSVLTDIEEQLVVFFLEGEEQNGGVGGTHQWV